MILNKRQKGLILVLGLFVIGMLAVTEIEEYFYEKPTYVTPSIIQIDDSYSSATINDVVSYKCIPLDSLFAPIIDTEGRPVDFQYTRQKKFLRPNMDERQCYQYIEIANVTDEKSDLVLSIYEFRVDQVDWYIYEDGEYSHQKTLPRSQDYNERAFPFYHYAFPFSIEAKDTMKILVQTRRFTGLMDVNISVAEQTKYLSQSSRQQSFQTIELTIYILLFFIMIAVGYSLNISTLFFLGLFILILTLSPLNTFGYCLFINFPDKIALNCGNLIVFLTFFSNVFYHPFGYAMVKKYLKKPRNFKIVAVTLASLNFISAVLFLFPQQDPDTFHTQMILVLAILTVINIGMAIYSMALIYLRGGAVIHLVVVLLTWGSFLFNEFKIKISGTPDSTAFFNSLFDETIYPIAGLIWIINIITTELMNKQKHRSELQYQGNQLETQRKLEIKEIGRNLHDNIGNSLASIFGYLQLKEDKTDVIKSLTLKTIKDIRILSHQLVDADFKSLSINLEELITQLNDFSTMRFHFYDQSEGAIDQISKARQGNVFRIVQELLTNILKHSQADNAYVQLFEYNSEFQVTVEDDGIGLPDHHESIGIGHKNIMERAELHNFTINTDSSSQGTSFFIVIPKETSN